MLRNIIKYLALLINLFFSLMYLFGIISVIVPSNKFVWFSYFGLIFPLLILSQIFFVIFWLFRRHKWYCLISLSLLIFSFPAVNRTFTLFHKEKSIVMPEQAKIKLLTYNVSMFSGEKHYQPIMKLIEDSNADIVCIQEFGFYNYTNQLTEDQILKRFQTNYPYRHLWYKNQKGKFSWGVATFSKYPIIKKKKVEYASAYNVSVFSDIIINKDTIRIFNNHLESNKLTMNDFKNYKLLSENPNREKFLSVTEQMSTKLSSAYRGRARQARIIAEEIRKSPYPVIVCGDFNDVPQSYTYHTISEGLCDVITATKYGYNYTFHNNGILVNIDHVLLNENYFTPISATIIHEPYSDHYPLLTEFQINKKPTK